MLGYPGRGEDCRLRCAWWRSDVTISRNIASRSERRSPYELALDTIVPHVAVGVGRNKPDIWKERISLR